MLLQAELVFHDQMIQQNAGSYELFLNGIVGRNTHKMKKYVLRTDERGIFWLLLFYAAHCIILNGYKLQQ